jgi:hypothetical protein
MAARARAAGRAPAQIMTSVVAVALVAFIVLLPRALAAQTVPSDARDATPGPSAPPPADAADAAASAQAQSAAAAKATQDLEARVIELRRELDAMERERASFDDLRRRVDDLEARQAALRGAASGDWMSAPASMLAGGDALRFTPTGLVLRSPGNRFLLRPTVRLQSIYEADLAHAGSADDTSPDSSAFRLAHAELVLEGHAFGPRFEYRFELDFADTTPGIAKDAFVQWRFLHDVALRVGQFKVPFGLETQYWNANLELVDVAAATTAFTLDRDVGLMIVGRPLGGRLQVHVAATNGPRAPCPRNIDGLRCDQVDLAYAARVVAAPFGPLPVFEGVVDGTPRPLVSVGVSGAYLLLPTDVRARTDVANATLDLDHDGRVDNIGVWQGAVELRALYRGASLQAEWLGRREQPGGGLADRTTWGAYGQLGVVLWPRRLQAIARVGRTDLPLYGLAASDRLLRGTRTTEETAGLSAYVHGHAAKLQVDYTHLSTPDAESAPEVNRVRAALQLAY